MLRVYGIPHCDTVRKALAWLDGHGISYEFVDFKKHPPDAPRVSRWCDRLGADAVLNRRGTTWRKLDPAVQAQAGTLEGTVDVLVKHPSAIKRPVIEREDGGTMIGFDATDYARAFAR